jgi:hypothetical protein
LIPLIIIVALGAGCEAAPRTPALPATGFFVAGEAAAFDQVLEGLEELRGTPLGSTAAKLRIALADCSDFALHKPADTRDGADADWDPASALTCEPDVATRDTVAHFANGDPLVFAVPAGFGGRLTGHLRVDPDGSVELVAQLDPLPEAGIAAALLPHADSPDAADLDDDNAVVYAHIRPDAGVDLTRLIDDDSQGAALFRLKSQLFSRAVLTGTLEAAIYAPPDDHALPGMAVAAAFTSRSIAVAAMESFIAELEETWSLEHSPLQLDLGGEPARGYAGACFLELRILPEFAPCYVATDRSIVVGWNRASLASALRIRAGAGEKSPPTHDGRLEIRLDRVAQVDRALQHAIDGAATVSPSTYPWQRLVVTAQRDGTPVQVNASLVSRTRIESIADARSTVIPR